MWIVYTIACALCLSLTDLFTKKYSHRLDDVSIALGRVVFALPILWAAVIIDGVPPLEPGIIGVYLVAIPFEVTAFLLYIRAIRVSPLSLTVPYLSFTPVFLLGTSPVILGEQSSLYAVPGIMLITAGAFVLNLHTARGGICAPLKATLKEKGSVYMLITAFIYSITSNLGKMGVMKSSPSFFAASYVSILSLAVLAIHIQKYRLKNPFKKELFIIGFFSAMMMLFHMTAIRLTLVSYMISVKRSSLLFSILFGAWFLGEKNLRERITGGIIMITGIVIITFWSRHH